MINRWIIKVIIFQVLKTWLYLAILGAVGYVGYTVFKWFRNRKGKDKK